MTGSAGLLADLKAATRRQKVVDAPLLNRLGLQVARTVVAAAWHRARRAPATDGDAVATAERGELDRWVRTVERDGLVVVEDFLPPEDFAAVAGAAAEVLRSSTPRTDVRHGSNRLVTVWRADMDPEARSVLDRFFTDHRLHQLAQRLERRPQHPAAGRCTLQHVVQFEGEPDRESAPHSDTFFPTHKVWLYLTDVSEPDGPLFYFPGSQRLSAASLRGTYRDSTGPATGSRRIDPGELRRRGLPRRVLTCRANTLVVANTFGYHGRSQGRPPGERMALHVELRGDPFRAARYLPEDLSRVSDGPSR